ncbi:hypothetical protein PSHT_15778 [Puccinia striiformis]|uniref:Uncharacterized protein n=1 Tax=Puccinia striiformis TaxID=27350 RepID=A0A2S4UD61_9BASI|nr:hypothetical protein PSHT_15778 [Puccinia striiformis]
MQLCQELILEFNDHGIFTVHNQIRMPEQSYSDAERFRRRMGCQLLTYDRVAGQGLYDGMLTTGSLCFT